MPDKPEQKDPKLTTAPVVTDKSLLSSVRKEEIKQEFEVGYEPAPEPQSVVKPAVVKPTKAAPTKEPKAVPVVPVEPVPDTEVGSDPSEEPAAEEQVGADKPYNILDDNDDPTGPMFNPKDDLDDGRDEKNSQLPHKRRNFVVRFFSALGHHKKWTIPLVLLIVLGTLAAVPYTRFFLAGLVVAHPYEVSVVDDVTKKPVTSADVTLDGKTVKTDSKGKAVIQRVKVGERTLSVSKKYYKSATRTVLTPIQGGGSQEVGITATGRQVPITVTNKLTGKPLENATLKAAGAEVKTDKDGKASVVLPVDKPTLNVTLSAAGFNELNTKIQVTDQTVKENSYTLVPSGKVYFLSRQSGKIDVVKTDLDGGNRKTVVFGTGKEEDRGTVLLASRDWKYLALYSKRDSGLAKLYLIETDSDKMSVMDEGNASFNLIGWKDHQFVYNVNRNGVKEWESNRQAIKSFNAAKKQILTIDQSVAEGEQGNYKTQYLESFYLVGGKIVYSVRWFGYTSYGTYGAAGKSHVIREASVDTLAKKDIKSFPVEQFEPNQFKLYAPSELYAMYYSNAESKYVFYEYENSSVKQVTEIDQNSFFEQTYPTYLASPSGKQTFWSEQRDGKATFFVGDSEGQAGKQVATLEDFQVYGWHSDDYLLMAKNGSELYILPVAGGTPVKVTDYHKPQYSYQGYGGGYGGL